MAIEKEKVTIIAEIGSNHNGDLDTALELIETSSKCGADIVKFQSYLVDDLLASDDPNYKILKELQVSKEWYPVLMDHCLKNKVGFLSTATNFTTLEWMEEYGADLYKVASCNITHRPLIDFLIKIGKPIIVSTGLASLEDITELAEYFKRNKFEKYSFLHCVSRYPTLPDELRLKNITILKELLNCPIGFSDHSHSQFMPVAAITLGAKIIEKHISLEKKGKGLDHEVSILPSDFKIMCNAIRDTEKALFADITPDKDNIFSMRRSLHFSRDIQSGSLISKDDIKIVRPEDGLLPKEITNIIGKELIREVKLNQPVKWEDIKVTLG